MIFLIKCLCLVYDWLNMVNLNFGYNENKCLINGYEVLIKWGFLEVW